MVAPALCTGASGPATEAFFGQFRADAFAAFAKLLIFASAVAALLVAPAFFERHRAMRAEFPVLVLFAALGMAIMVSATNLMTLYVGLELNSLAAYVLAAFLRNDERSAEAGLKYFVLGALASGHPAVRDEPDLRLHRHDQFRRHRRGAGQRTVDRGAVRDRLHACGPGLQDQRSAVPHVDPRRL